MIKLSRRSRKALKVWLSLDISVRGGECPFYKEGLVPIRYHCKYECSKTFPKTAKAISNLSPSSAKDQYPNRCPCDFYKHAIVIKRIRKALRDNGEVLK